MMNIVIWNINKDETKKNKKRKEEGGKTNKQTKINIHIQNKSIRNDTKRILKVLYQTGKNNENNKHTNKGVIKTNTKKITKNLLIFQKTHISVTNTTRKGLITKNGIITTTNTKIQTTK